MMSIIILKSYSDVSNKNIYAYVLENTQTSQDRTHTNNKTLSIR